MKLAPLPQDVQALLKRAGASPRLVAHLTLVHDAAVAITNAISNYWPDLSFDRAAVLFGAATHDIGKVLNPDELSRPGTEHELAGQNLLVSLGVTEERARFARTHGSWGRELDVSIEDLLVALADKAWRGSRNQKLESMLSKRIAQVSQEDQWQVYLKLDDFLMTLGEDAHDRLLWQAEQPE